MPRPMKRWNHKGSTHAKVRMAELRDRKLQLRKSDLILKWATVTGRGLDGQREWWTAAQAAGIREGCGVHASIEFLERAIEQATEAAAFEITDLGRAYLIQHDGLVL